MNRIIRPTMRRAAVGLAVPALGLSALAGSAPSYADPTPSGTAGSTWLSGQLQNGLLQIQGFPGYGQSIDAALSATEVGDTGTATTIRNAVAADIDDYISGDAFGDEGSTYAGATAKALVLAQRTGGTPAAFGGVNLVQRLEAVVSGDAATAGRIQDVSEFGDFANTIGQSFAVEGLTRTVSAKAKPASDFLVEQQCAAGFFRLSFSAPDAPDQSCASDPAATPDTDVTAFAVLALATRPADADAAAALDKAVAWLMRTRGANGGFGGGDLTEAANTNSTGLAASALGAACEVAAADGSADFVRSLQVDGGEAGTALADEVGAIAYDPAALAAGRTAGITPESGDQWKFATAQATGALAWDDAAPATVSFGPTARFAKAGSRPRPRLIVNGVAAGERVCVTSSGRGQAILGTGRPLRVAATYQGRTATIGYGATTGPGRAERSITFLAPKKLRFKLKAQTRQGRTQVVRVTSLEAGEKVRVYFRGRKVDTGVVRRNGTYVGRFEVTGPTGRAGVKVVGQFTTRTGISSFRVVR